MCVCIVDLSEEKKDNTNFIWRIGATVATLAV